MDRLRWANARRAAEIRYNWQTERRLQLDNTIWLIDDDPSNRESMAFLLSGMGWPVRRTESVDAFTAAHARDTELVGCMLLDMRMPGKGGLTGLRRGNGSGPAASDHHDRARTV